MFQKSQCVFWFEDQIEKIWNHSYEKFIWDGWQKLKVKTDQAFVLTLILFNLVTTGKELCTTQKFLQPE